MPNGVDFDFPVETTCEACGEVTMRNVSGHTDWNSTRHYSYKHAEKVHGLSHTFQGNVKTAWRDAKGAIASGMTEVYIEGDSDTPAFTARRVA